MPLVQAGATGAGQTLAIVSDTNFTRTIPVHFWKDVRVTRTGSFTVEHVDDSASGPVPADQTEAGGTTLPLSGTDTTVSPSVSVTIPAERAWGEDYLPLAALEENGNLAQAVILLELTLPKGGGGGISTVWPLPAYQQDLAGIARTSPDQALIQFGGTPTVLYQPPAGYAGRNLPDLSANADAHTGYLVRTPKGLGPSAGGTSFVSPQFAGTLALIDQALGHRVGQLNPLLYTLQRTGVSPARAILTGDNWAFRAKPGYSQATGLGALDGERLFEGLRSFDLPSSR